MEVQEIFSNNPCPGEHVPYGADMLIDVSPEASLGILACVQGIESGTVDDPDGSGATDDEPHVGLSDAVLEDDISSLQ